MGLLTAEKIDEAQCKQDARKDKECNRRSDGGDGYKGRNEGADDAADGICSAELSRYTSAVFQGINGVLDQRRRHGSQKEQRIDKYDKTGEEGCPDQEICADRDHHQRGNSEDDIFAEYRNRSDPDGGDEDSPIQPVRVRIFICRASAVHVAEGHRNHYGSDNNGPHDL